jgi:hypothetical protein
VTNVAITESNNQRKVAMKKINTEKWFDEGKLRLATYDEKLPVLGEMQAADVTAPIGVIEFLAENDLADPQVWVKANELSYAVMNSLYSRLTMPEPTEEEKLAADKLAAEEAAKKLGATVTK